MIEIDAKSTITLIIGVITCIIGVLSFVASRMKAAENEGRIAEKLDACLKSIDEVKSEVKAQTIAQNNQNIILERHSQQIENISIRLEHLEDIKDG